ncbi:hypothetical protein RB653_006572 [Dictyostelium firmibasis]|uniref:UBX domain-containing protein n=1 Tax=Dictyostelium firmibasis TaxID=79012 RepID=A0AAN7TMC4_9MYCE
MEDPDILSNFLSITGCEDSALATTILENNNWDVERSVDFFFTMNDPSNVKSSSSPSSSTTKNTSSPTASSGFEYNEEEFRDPIPQIMETLVDHSYHPPPQRSYQKQNNVFEAFRDFEKERGINQDKMTDKQKSLAELFKPPLDILSFGTFDEIKKIGEQKKCFVLVNIQDVTEFDCQKLNRDTWSNKDLKELVSENFVFWQVNNANSEGKWFTQIYPVFKFPYIAIIDPRTGQKLQDMTGFIDAEEMAQYLVTFLSTNSFSGQIEAPLSGTTKKQKKYNTEDEELELAIQLSLKQEQEKSKSGSTSPPPNKNNNSTTTTSTATASTNRESSTNRKKEDQEEEDDDVDIEDEQFEGEDDEEIEDNYDDNYYYSDTVQKEITEEEQKKVEIKQLVEKIQVTSKIGTEGDCVIQIRCPGETLKGQFHSHDQIKNIYYYVQVKTGISNFKLFTSFPKVDLSGELLSKTLKEMDLAPRAVLNMLQE